MCSSPRSCIVLLVSGANGAPSGKETMFSTMAEVKRADQANDHHWFDRDTMRFFSSRVESDLICGEFFVSSERFDEDAPRLFTVRRVATKRGEIRTVGAFQEHATLGHALAAAAAEAAVAIAERTNA